MMSERVQRQIDRLLDEAEAAMAAEDWSTVRARCGAALALEVFESTYEASSLSIMQTTHGRAASRYGSLARLMFLLGDDDESRAHLESWWQEVTRALSAGEHNPLQPAFFQDVMRVRQASDSLVPLGTEEMVRWGYDAIAEIPVGFASYVSIDRLRGGLALRLGLVDEAEQHFLTGLEYTERARCPVEAGRNHQGLADIAL